MTITRPVSQHMRTLLLVALALAPFGMAGAWQSNPQSSGQQFQQAAQQQQTRDQLQKSQLDQRLHQSVSDNAKRPTANSPGIQQQMDAADRVQRERARAAQQDLLDRERDTPMLPRVAPKDSPAPPRSG
ncbi:hypothetical protein [Rhodanobacter terrae]|uniref:Uncharacterized protein n=1 Tax=Rhodanobacter terrae TaxID=418647 RepID=A0ABW0SSN9_9GAMM